MDVADEIMKLQYKDSQSSNFSIDTKITELSNKGASNPNTENSKMIDVIDKTEVKTGGCRIIKVIVKDKIVNHEQPVSKHSEDNENDKGGIKEIRKHSGCMSERNGIADEKAGESIKDIGKGVMIDEFDDHSDIDVYYSDDETKDDVNDDSIREEKWENQKVNLNNFGVTPAKLSDKEAKYSRDSDRTNDGNKPAELLNHDYSKSLVDLTKDVPRKFRGSRSLRVVCKRLDLTAQRKNKKQAVSSFQGRVCGSCGVKVTTKMEWDNHCRYKHNKKLKYYKCDICTYRTPYLSTFKRHKEMHEYRNQKMHGCNNEVISSNICDQCGKCYMSRGNLLTHIKTHSNPKSFKCTVCEKVFSQKGNLKSHLLRHQKQEEKKQKEKSDPNSVNKAKRLQPSEFPCNYCRKVFRWKGDCSRHVKTIHYGIKKFTCSQCHKYFADITALRIHQLNHSGTKPFKCAHCEKSYSNKYNLENHVSNKHEYQ